MDNVLTVQGSDGRALPTAQPVGSSVTGSPFTATSGTSVGPTAELTGLLMIIATENIHIRFSKDGTDAANSDFLIPSNQVFSFPVDADRVEVIADSSTATVYMHLAKTAG